MAEEVRTYSEDEQLKLRDIESIYGYQLRLGEEKIGIVEDFVFDEVAWGVRFIVVDASESLPGKRLLVSSLDLTQTDWEEERLAVKISKDKLRYAALDRGDPLSRKFQLELYEKFNWVPYWIESEYHDIPPHPKKVKSGLPLGEELKQDPHLFSTRELLEFRLTTLNGDAGQIVDFVVDEEDWLVYYLVVETDDDPNPRRVLVSTDWISRIGREEGLVYSDLSIDLVRSAPEYDPAVPLTRDKEIDLYDYYGRPHYWVEGGDVNEDSDDVGQGTQGD